MRQVGLSVLKTICCFCAVTFYSASQLCNEFCFVNNHFLSILYFLSIVATPLFFLINGYSDHKTYSTQRLFQIDWSKILSVLFIFAFWNAVSYLLFSKNGFNSYFLQSWLLISLATIYVLNPIFTIVLSHYRWAYLALLLFVVFIAFLDILTLLNLNGQIEKVPSHFRIWTWCFYYYIGRFLALRKIRLISKRKKVRYYAKLFCFPLMFSFYLYELLLSKYVFKAFNATYFLDSVLLIAMTLTIFIIFDNIKIKTKILTEIFHFIAPAMIGVYILHDAIYFYLLHWFPTYEPTIATLYFFIVFTLSVIISRLLLLNSVTSKLIKI
ncbi:acyltransferase family protein [Thorsellia kenyensis]|uniref:Acyltransferase family protein n=1 Tax=Thorsellia kenyensis TaxID=1549888 RepID=A0ABV6C962_9GAMM